METGREQEPWAGQRFSYVSLTQKQRDIVSARFQSKCSSTGTIDAYEVEGLAAELLESTLTDAILDTIIDLTDDDDSVVVDAAGFERIMSAVLSQTTRWGALRNAVSGPVGVGSLISQEGHRSLKRGFEFNCMVVGESSLGKTTLVNTLFRSDVSRRTPGVWEAPASTTSIHTVSHVIEEQGVRLKLSVTDSPGFGDLIDNSRSFDPIVDYITKQYSTYLETELGVKRPPRIPDTRVHALLYFISPTGHGLKPLDISFMKKVHQFVNIIPVIGKADALTLQERSAFKQRIREDIENNEINLFPWSLQSDDADDESSKAEAKSKLPFAVVGATEERVQSGKVVRGRNTRWGFIDVDNPDHCEFALLRDALIRVYLCDLIDTTAQVHYENFRQNFLIAKATV
eukprot:m.33123 g.33123  ORF g.33123 m.33123 type:complete len:400 (-) comp16762_c1_seq1:62-1261(-)